MILRPDLASLRRLGPDLVLLATGLPLALAAIAVLWPLMLASAALAVLWVGVLLFPLTLALASTFARRDRRRLHRWGVDVQPPRYRERGRGPAGPLRMVTDPRRWLDLAFEALVALPLRALTAGTALGWILGAAAGLTYWLWGRLLPPAAAVLPGQWALALLLGIAMALATPVVVHALARTEARLTAPLLGSARQAPRRPVAEPAASLTGSTAALAENAWLRMSVAVTALVLAVVGWPVTAVLYAVDPAIAMVLAVAHSVAALLAIRWPWAGLSLAVLSALAMMLATSGELLLAPWPWPVTTILAHCLTITMLAVLHRWYWAVSTWSAGAALTLVALLVADPAQSASGTLREVLTNGVVLVAISGGFVLLGLTVHQWILVSGQVERAESLGAAELRRRHELEERGRIARELHDVVAHSMSVITVQASTAAYRLPGLDAQTVREFEEIAASSRQALGEMRSLLTMLRAPSAAGESAPVTVPLPDLDGLEALISASRASGAQIRTRLHAVTVPPTVGLTAYRVVQEALANAVRHARGAPIEIVVERDGALLRIEVVNGPAAQQEPPIPGSGLGLAGTRERVEALGGQVETGPTADGGFAVRARLPLADPLPQ